MRRSLGLLLVLGAAGLAAAAGNPSTPAADAPSSQESPAEFQETEQPQWDHAAPAVAAAKPALPKDPKLDDVNAELDRLDKRPAAGEPLRLADRASSFKANILRTVEALALVLAAFLALVYLFKRYGRRTPFLAGPGLGTLLGKLYLSPRASLHFVRTGGRVLVIGVSPAGVSLVSEFDGSAFEAESGIAETASVAHADAEAPGPPAEPRSFLAHLDAQARGPVLEPAPVSPPKPPEEADTDLESLRQDIRRLQTYLRDNLRGE